MKKKEKKKWIPRGIYCHGNGTKKYPNCKWRKYITTIKRNKDNCEHANECSEECWSKPSNSCYNLVYKCEYMKYIDWTQDSLLWDACKECGVKDD